MDYQGNFYLGTNITRFSWLLWSEGLDVESNIGFDKKTSIVYIPKAYYFATDGTELGYDLQAQLLVTPELGRDVNVSVEVENHSGADVVLKDGTAENRTWKRS